MAADELTFDDDSFYFRILVPSLKKHEKKEKTAIDIYEAINNPHFLVQDASDTCVGLPEFSKNIHIFVSDIMSERTKNDYIFGIILKYYDTLTFKDHHSTNSRSQITLLVLLADRMFKKKKIQPNAIHYFSQFLIIQRVSSTPQELLKILPDKLETLHENLIKSMDISDCVDVKKKYQTKETHSRNKHIFCEKLKENRYKDDICIFCLIHFFFLYFKKIAIELCIDYYITKNPRSYDLYDPTLYQINQNSLLRIIFKAFIKYNINHSYFHLLLQGIIISQNFFYEFSLRKSEFKEKIKILTHLDDDFVLYLIDDDDNDDSKISNDIKDLPKIIASHLDWDPLYVIDISMIFACIIDIYFETNSTIIKKLYSSRCKGSEKIKILFNNNLIFFG